MSLMQVKKRKGFKSTSFASSGSFQTSWFEEDYDEEIFAPGADYRYGIVIPENLKNTKLVVDLIVDTKEIEGGREEIVLTIPQQIDSEQEDDEKRFGSEEKDELIKLSGKMNIRRTYDVSGLKKDGAGSSSYNPFELLSRLFLFGHLKKLSP